MTNSVSRPSIKTCSKSGLMKLTGELSKGGFDFSATIGRRLTYAELIA